MFRKGWHPSLLPGLAILTAAPGRCLYLGDLAGPLRKGRTMNGIHDLGGMHGLGPVVREENEPVFHADWERAVFAMMLYTMGKRLYNAAEFRHGIERMPPAHYLTARYYERWLHSLERNLLEKGIVSREELEERARQFLEDPAKPLPRREDPEFTAFLLHLVREGGQRSARLETPPRFQVGDRVRARNLHPPGHTRLARYVRGRQGTVAHVYDPWTFPDTHAHGQGRNPQYVYCVRFEARELWGESAEPNQAVYFDLWESYLEPAEGPTAPEREEKG